MGFAAGIVAGVVAFVIAPLAAGWIAQWVGWALAVSTVVGLAIPVHRRGHRNFQGGNTDLAAYLAVVAIWGFIALPRMNASRMACADRDDVAGRLLAAQEAERERNGAYAADVGDLPGWGDAAGGDSGVHIDVEEASDTLFLATVSHPMCRGGEVVSVSSAAP